MSTKWNTKTNIFKKKNNTVKRKTAKKHATIPNGDWRFPWEGNPQTSQRETRLVCDISPSRDVTSRLRPVAQRQTTVCALLYGATANGRQEKNKTYVLAGRKPRRHAETPNLTASRINVRYTRAPVVLVGCGVPPKISNPSDMRRLRKTRRAAPTPDVARKYLLRTDVLNELNLRSNRNETSPSILCRRCLRLSGSNEFSRKYITSYPFRVRVEMALILIRGSRLPGAFLKTPSIFDDSQNTSFRRAGC